jgi:RNA polymerase sigma factor (sigma-70 family)
VKADSRSLDADLGGDPVAYALDFDIFYDLNLDRLFQALALTIGNEELARDAAAEGMARAYQRWASVSAYSNPTGWVYRVGLNWANSRLRKRRREISSNEPPEGALLDPDIADPQLEEALASLPSGQRAVVVLRYFLDWSEADTAAALSIRPGTVKSRLSRALDQLADLLGGGR